MSIIQLPIAELKPALVGLGKIISKRTTLPVLGMVKIDRTKDGWITLTGTNLDQFATVRFEQPTDGEANSILVSYEDLNKALKVCGKSDYLDVEVKNDKQAILRYAIGSQTVETPVDTLPVEEFPVIPRVEAEAMAVTDSLREALHQAFACASTDQTRYVITGAFIDVSQKDCHQVVGTNGRQLYASNSFTLPLEQSLIIPPSKFIGWKDFNNDGAWQLKVVHKKKDERRWLQLSSRRWRFLTCEIEGNFPNYRQVLLDPTKFHTTLELDPEGLANIITMVAQMPCHDVINQTLGIEVKDGDVTLLGRAPNAEQWTRLGIQARVRGGDITTYLNREFFAQALKFGLNTVELVDAMSPLRMSNDGRQLIIMPVRVDGPEQTSVTKTPIAIQPPAVVDDSDVKSKQIEGIAPSQPEKPNMNTTSDTSDGKSQPSVGFSGKIDEAIETIEALQDTFKDGLSTLKDLGGKLKTIQREHKTSDKEVQGIRNTLRSLQAVRF